MITARLFDTEDISEWESLCQSSINGTFLHTRRYLSYHADRFKDFSIVIEQNEKIIGILPIATYPSEIKVATSHPGITYGGIVHKGELRGKKMIDALQAACHILKSHGFQEFIYKAIPSIYHQTPAEDDVYALFTLHAQKIRCDLSSAIYLPKRLELSDRRKRALKKSKTNNLLVRCDNTLISESWDLISENLRKRYAKEPTHSKSELQWLTDAFPENIRNYACINENDVVATCIVFNTRTVSHLQYTATNETGRKLNATDLIIEKAIDDTIKEGRHYFNFGTSTENNGHYLNNDLNIFKNEFGASGCVHDFYSIKLES